MSLRLPDFAALDFDDIALAPVDRTGGEAWATPEGLDVKPAYGPDDVAGLDFLDGYPGLAPFARGPYPTMYVTNPWT
ncbi:methylmalonyl-CoA mutase, partial [Pseudomonas sp. GW460-R15]|uniref:methylmalonyl-CoA mutase family protein n=1 Tax=Pseudomonas sp. GW460-R15 TaxID=2075557 RepID=UPI000CD3A71E